MADFGKPGSDVLQVQEIAGRSRPGVPGEPFPWADRGPAPNALCASTPSDARTSSSQALTRGERAAAIYSLLGSAKLNGLDPEIYLQHVLERIADYPISRIAELLPWNASIPVQLTPS